MLERVAQERANRFLYYSSKLVVEGVRPGEGYDLMPTVVSVILYDEHVVFPESPEVVSVCRLVWDCGGQTHPGSERMAFVLVDLQKFRAQHPTLDGDVRGDEMLSWLYLLTEGYKDEEAVRSMVEFIPTVERFAQAYGLALDDPDIKHAYDQYVSCVMTENNILRRERREGFAEGRAEGVESVIGRLRAAGVDPALLDAALAAEIAGE